MRFPALPPAEEDIAGQACGASLRNPFGRGDRHRPGALHDGCAPIEGLHLKVLRSPHAHARILRIDRDTRQGRARA